MTFTKSNFLVPAIFMAGSFLSLLLCMLLTNPMSNVAYLIIYFLSLLVFLVSLGNFLVLLRYGAINANRRNKIYILSILFVAVVMFSSAQSLSLADFFILVLITFGMLFYSSKRVS